MHLLLLGATGLVGRHVLSQALATSSVTSVTAPARRALQVARLAHRHGTSTFVLNSAMGADRGSRFFYNRVKGEVEHDLADVGFASLTIVRPGLIEGDREEVRPGERFALLALRALDPLLPRQWRRNPADVIAAALLEAALAATPGVQVVASDRLTSRA